MRSSRFIKLLSSLLPPPASVPPPARPQVSNMKNLVGDRSSGCRLLFCAKVLDRVAEFHSDSSTKTTCLKGIKEPCRCLSTAQQRQQTASANQTLLESFKRSQRAFFSSVFFPFWSLTAREAAAVVAASWPATPPSPLSDLTPADSGGPLDPLFKAQGEHHAESVSSAAFVRDMKVGGVLKTLSVCLSVLSGL